MLINNPIEYITTMNIKIQQVLNSVTERLVLELGNIIDEEVYSYQSTGEWDGRTGQFKQSWSASIPELVGGWWESKIDNQDFDFTWNSTKNKWSHGNSFQPLENNDDLNEIINNRQGGSNFGFPALQRPYWDKFINYCSLNIDIIFKEECIKIGIPIEYATIFLA